VLFLRRPQASGEAAWHAANAKLEAEAEAAASGGDGATR
jgi:hypothetical protein